MSIVIEHFDGVMQLTLNRPEAANSVTVEMALEIAAAIESFTADETARVMVVTGAGERSFCAGGDVSSLLEICEHQQADRAGPLGFARLDPGKPTKGEASPIVSMLTIRRFARTAVFMHRQARAAGSRSMLTDEHRFLGARRDVARASIARQG